MAIEIGIALGLTGCIVIGWVIVEQIRQRYIVSRFLRERGMTLSELERQEPNSGTVLLDHVYGRSIGLPAPTVWWTPHDTEQPYPCDIVTERSKLIDAPKSVRNVMILKKRFGQFPILESNCL
jgi:hypothetical protein